MPNVTRLRVSRISLSVALVASILGLNSLTDSVSAQGKETNDGVTIQKNADGSVDAYDAGETEELEDNGGGGGAVPNDGRIHYRPGTTPYTKKLSDGTTVRRNSDGSIETWDEGETQHWSGGLGGGGGSTHHKRSVKRTTKSAGSSAKAKTTTTSVKKKTK
jgi:hypothetical protein